MSRTHAHTPAAVERARTTDQSIQYTLHRHWAAGYGLVTCLDPRARCEPRLPRWASTQPWTRRGNVRIERRAAVRDTLRRAAGEYRGSGQIDDPVMPDPDRYCLCEWCGGR